MRSPLRLLRRVAQASPHELWTRSRQLLYTIRNYAGCWTGGSALSHHGHRRSLGLNAREIAVWWRERQAAWFLDPARIGLLRDCQDVPESCIPWVIERADDVLRDRLPLFSYGVIGYDMPHRWHHDPTGQKTAPPRFYGLVPYLDASVVGDTKHVWEPNRFAWALWLGIAYRITGNQEYADKFRRWTLDWFHENPYPVGINYCSALELAYRNYAWLWSLQLFAEFLATDDELLDRLLHGIWTASRHIEANLSRYFAPNTHILGEAFGLYTVGAAIPEFRESERWRCLGQALLELEAGKQFYQDGMHRELSSGYHLYSTDIYLQSVLIGRQTGFPVSATVEQTGRRAARRLAELVPHDLRMPLFNDCDGGRLTSFVPQAQDAGPSLIAAQDLFPQESFLPVSTTRRGYPLLMSSPATGPTALHVTGTLADDDFEGRDLHTLYDSGLASYRSPDGDYLLFRGSEFGYHDCPHSHDGGLGIILYLKGVPVFVDSGVGSYTQSQAVRNAFRSAHGKNTILVNGQGPSKPADWFSWSRKTDSQLVWRSRFRGGFNARARHAGFSTPPHLHTFVQREIIMLENGMIAIADRWDADESIAVETRFTLHPDLELDSARKVLRSEDNQHFHFEGYSLRDGESIPVVVSETHYSANYGLHTKTRSIAFHAAPSRRGGMVTFVSRCGPITRRADGNVGTEAECAGGATFELTPHGVFLHQAPAVEPINC